MNIPEPLSHWYSYVVWKFLDDSPKAKFRSLEKVEKKIIETRLHLEFNQIYINIYIYINICQLIDTYTYIYINACIKKD